MELKEFLHPDFEQSGKEKVSSFVDDDQQRKAEYQLEGANQKCFHCELLRLFMV